VINPKQITKSEKGKRKKKMRNTYLEEDECKKKKEWQGGSTQVERNSHTRKTRKTTRVNVKEKEDEKREI